MQQIEAAPTALWPDVLTPDKLRHLYRKAAQSGAAEAQRALAEHLRRNATSAAEFTESTLRLRRAAKAGDRIAMRLLAQAYGLGIGTSPAPAMASFWLEKAALAGDAAAADLVPGLGRGQTD